MKDLFRRFSHRAAIAVGSVWAFFIALLVVVVWAVTGPLFHFSDTWQLVINTGTTVVTFLMVFLIQATQNRDSREIHLKLDELLRAVTKARTGLANLDDLSDRELDNLLQEFHQARERKGMSPLVVAEESGEDDGEDGEE
ncbi:MAG TPA: low affinity iron permease family protein [Thermoanaerobaculia bacterium]|nr:low affinity iron permease family protein [Thermoanaerobaculia bacterium]